MSSKLDGSGYDSNVGIKRHGLGKAGDDAEKFLIGITGGIGSGKSTVSRFWSLYSKLSLIDIDKICALLLQKNEPGWQQLKEHLDGTFFVGMGSLIEDFCVSPFLLMMGYEQRLIV